jgi:LysR family transcriptional regulator, regulator for bpeEF and oprC
VLEDSTLIARHLGDLETLTAASPSYLQRFGTPSTPDDLDQHLAVHRFSGLSDRPSDFNFNVNGRAVDVK